MKVLKKWRQTDDDDDDDNDDDDTHPWQTIVPDGIYSVGDKNVNDRDDKCKLFVQSVEGGWSEVFLL